MRPDQAPPRPSSPARRRPQREFAFLLSDVARLLRTITDQRAKDVGSSRARWAVLVRIERCEGQSQNELASSLDIQPITLGRLVDKLCDEGLVDRRPDPADRRIKRLHLTERAHPVLQQLSAMGAEMMGKALAGIDGAALEGMIRDLGLIKENLKSELRTDSTDDKARAS
jgi:MarR family transcriptional regulator, transcriptional regulator for hemolysin